jgi:hypothetical protein
MLPLTLPSAVISPKEFFSSCSSSWSHTLDLGMPGRPEQVGILASHCGLVLMFLKMQAY